MSVCVQDAMHVYEEGQIMSEAELSGNHQLTAHCLLGMADLHQVRDTLHTHTHTHTHTHRHAHTHTRARTHTCTRTRTQDCGYTSYACGVRQDWYVLRGCCCTQVEHSWIYSEALYRKALAIYHTLLEAAVSDVHDPRYSD